MSWPSISDEAGTVDLDRCNCDSHDRTSDWFRAQPRPMETPRQPTNWLARFGRRRHASPDADADLFVSLWKAAWVEGAKARWTPDASTANPYAAGMERSAWDAGWEWAGQNPDRRRNLTPIWPIDRRATDSPAATSVKRAMGLGGRGRGGLRARQGGRPPRQSPIDPGSVPTGNDALGRPVTG